MLTILCFHKQTLSQTHLFSHHLNQTQSFPQLQKYLPSRLPLCARQTPLYMSFRQAALKTVASCILEVEQKFRSLAVRELSQQGGIPHFKSLQRLPSERIQDSYYDRSKLLLSAGAWVRKRNGQWEAKIKKGGNFTNSRFEELSGVEDVSAHVRSITGIDELETNNFGLDPTATFVTERETWIADKEFHIVLDRMDFGHEVGEVELQQAVAGVDGHVPTEQEKKKMMDEMDNRISVFMKHYSWAFTPGEPKGKLTAYFELMQAAAKSKL